MKARNGQIIPGFFYEALSRMRGSSAAYKQEISAIYSIGKLAGQATPVPPNPQYPLMFLARYC